MALLGLPEVFFRMHGTAVPWELQNMPEYSIQAYSVVLLVRETTGYAGGGTSQKSFSFKHRAKRANSKGTYKVVQRSDRRGSARLRAAEQSMQSKEYSVRL